jgi:hypothetical protein
MVRRPGTAELIGAVAVSMQAVPGEDAAIRAGSQRGCVPAGARCLAAPGSREADPGVGKIRRKGAGRVLARGRWSHGPNARRPRRRQATRVACPAWRPDPARCLGPGHWWHCRAAGACRVAGPSAADLPVRPAAAGLGPDLRQPGVRCPAARTGDRHRYPQAARRAAGGRSPRASSRALTSAAAPRAGSSACRHRAAGRQPDPR